MNRAYPIILMFLLFEMSGILYGQSLLNQIDSLYMNNENKKALILETQIQADSSYTDSEKKALSAYMEMRKILTDHTLSDRQKKNRLDQCLFLADNAVNTSPPSPDAYYARGLNRMFAANLVREFSSLNNITAARDDFVTAINLDKNHYGSISELAGIYGYMPEMITFGDKNIAVSLSKYLLSIRGTRRDACQLAALLQRRNLSSRKRSALQKKIQDSYRNAKTPFEAASLFEGSIQNTDVSDDKSEVSVLKARFNLSDDEISGENAWSRNF